VAVTTVFGVCRVLGGLLALLRVVLGGTVDVPHTGFDGGVSTGLPEGSRLG
jgi:hypothetical protein